MKLRCIAVDDEPKALEILKDYIEKVPFFDLAGIFRDSLKALDYFQHNKVDLIFLDINMPDLTGIQFLKSLIHQPLIIFTTAYSEYAIESYDYAALDYLLKPIEFERFLKGANRALEQFLLNQQNFSTRGTELEKSDFIFVKSGTDIYKVKIDEILYIESVGNYVNFVLKNNSIMSLFSMNEILQILPANQFFRIHKSFIIDLRFVSKIERHQVIISNKEIPIGNVYRESFFKAIEKNGRKYIREKGVWR